MAVDLKALKTEYVNIYNENIKREGADKLLEFLSKRDFFTAPASTKYHSAFDGGLVLHSLNVYHCLKAYLERTRVKEQYKLSFNNESIAVSALLHDICKTDIYKKGFRNVKNEQGIWEQVPTYNLEDNLPYGHGEKSVYMISGYMKLTRDEAMAIRWHMGFSGTEEKNLIGNALEKYPLAFALSTADMEASYFME